jgi:hypothetical protein
MDDELGSTKMIHCTGHQKYILVFGRKGRKHEFGLGTAENTNA